MLQTPAPAAQPIPIGHRPMRGTAGEKWSHVRGSVFGALSGTPLGDHAQAIAHMVSAGGSAEAIATTPAPLRGLVATAARSALVGGLNRILLVAAFVAFAAAAASCVLIRERDFVTTAHDETEYAR